MKKWTRYKYVIIVLFVRSVGSSVPADMRRNNNVFMTSKRRRDVVLTS